MSWYSSVSHAPEVESEPVESEPGGMVRCRSFGSFKHEFQLEDATDFIKDGLQVGVVTGGCGHIVQWSLYL